MAFDLPGEMIDNSAHIQSVWVDYMSGALEGVVEKARAAHGDPLPPFQISWKIEHRDDSFSLVCTLNFLEGRPAVLAALVREVVGELNNRKHFHISDLDPDIQLDIMRQLTARFDRVLPHDHIP